MIVVAIIGVLAAIAIPAFINYVARSKTSEAPANLKSMFQLATSYYPKERWAGGVVAEGGAAPSVHCVVGSASPTTYSASNSKTNVDWTAEHASFQALGFMISDPVYYEYHIVTGAGGSSCAQPAGSSTVYSLRAHGDLDGDSDTSLFEMAVGSDAQNELYRAPGLYEDDPLE